MDKNLIIRALRQSALFQHLSEDELLQIATISKLRQYFPDDTIVWQGKASDSLFVIVNGIVAVKKIISQEKEHLLAYLMPGFTFGEVGILDNQPRSATVSALSDVDVLVIRRDDFMEILYKSPSVAVELAKMLGRYLVETSKRNAMANRNVRLILIINLAGHSGATTLGTLTAYKLAQKTGGKGTVYFEYPNPVNLLNDLQFPKNTRLFHHPAGFDVMAEKEETYSPIPNSARTTLMLDQVMQSHENIIIGIQGKMDENISLIMEYARQVLIIASPDATVFEAGKELRKNLKKTLSQDQSSVFLVLNHPDNDQQLPEYQEKEADFCIPFLEGFPVHEKLLDKEISLPSSLKDTMELITDRLERTNQISVFIPTTVDVKVASDTSAYVTETLNFLAERFGGATCREAQGVWNSETAGLVGETVHIVSTYVTNTDLKKYLDEVVDFIKKLKVILHQEAMALEVNQKLTLI